MPDQVGRSTDATTPASRHRCEPIPSWMCPITALEWVERDRREPDKVLANVSSARRQVYDLESRWSADLTACAHEYDAVIEDAVEDLQAGRVEAALRRLLDALPSEDA